MAVHRLILSTSLTATLLVGWASCATLCAQDSLWVRGGIQAGGDGIPAEVHWRFGPAAPDPGLDTLWMPVHRQAPLTCWGSSEFGRSQMEANWPRYTDSVTVSLFPDSSGLVLCLGPDTLRQKWTLATSGCFPATPSAAFQTWLLRQSDTPFERRRHDAALAWLQDHCLTVPHLGRLLDSFDDEGRRLTLLKRAQVVRPGQLGTLSNRFFSSHYRAAFDAWLSEQN